MITEYQQAYAPIYLVKRRTSLFAQISKSYCKYQSRVMMVLIKVLWLGVFFRISGGGVSLKVSQWKMPHHVCWWKITFQSMKIYFGLGMLVSICEKMRIIYCYTLGYILPNKPKSTFTAFLLLSQLLLSWGSVNHLWSNS